MSGGDGIALARICALVLTNVAQASLTILPRNEAFLGLSMDTVSAAQGFAMVGLWFAIFLLGLYAHAGCFSTDGPDPMLR
jgi:hypothetical protein